MPNALIVVDVQNDFCEGGALAVKGGAAVATRIADYLDLHHDDYDYKFASKDWHVDPGSHWSDTPDFVDSWPVHCRAGEKGSEFHPNLRADHIEWDGVYKKGRYAAAYSALAGYNGGSHFSLRAFFESRRVTSVDVVGIAYDFCVKETVLDLANTRAHPDIRVITDLTASVHPEQDDKTDDFVSQYATLVHSGLRKG